jgi:hypothetical protein
MAHSVFMLLVLCWVMLVATASVKAARVPTTDCRGECSVAEFYTDGSNRTRVEYVNVTEVDGATYSDESTITITSDATDFTIGCQMVCYAGEKANETETDWSRIKNVTTVRSDLCLSCTQKWDCYSVVYTNESTCFNETGIVEGWTPWRNSSADWNCTGQRTTYVCDKVNSCYDNCTHTARNPRGSNNSYWNATDVNTTKTDCWECRNVTARECFFQYLYLSNETCTKYSTNSSYLWNLTSSLTNLSGSSWNCTGGGMSIQLQCKNSTAEQCYNNCTYLHSLNPEPDWRTTRNFTDNNSNGSSSSNNTGSTSNTNNSNTTNNSTGTRNDDPVDKRIYQTMVFSMTLGEGGCVINSKAAKDAMRSAVMDALLKGTLGEDSWTDSWVTMRRAPRVDTSVSPTNVTVVQYDYEYAVYVFAFSEIEAELIADVADFNYANDAFAENVWANLAASEEIKEMPCGVTSASELQFSAPLIECAGCSGSASVQVVYLAFAAAALALQLIV